MIQHKQRKENVYGHCIGLADWNNVKLASLKAHFWGLSLHGNLYLGVHFSLSYMQNTMFYFIMTLEYVKDCTFLTRGNVRAVGKRLLWLNGLVVFFSLQFSSALDYTKSLLIWLQLIPPRGIKLQGSKNYHHPQRHYFLITTRQNGKKHGCGGSKGSISMLEWEIQLLDSISGAKVCITMQSFYWSRALLMTLPMPPVSCNSDHPFSHNHYQHLCSSSWYTHFSWPQMFSNPHDFGPVLTALMKAF